MGWRLSPHPVNSPSSSKGKPSSSSMKSPVLSCTTMPRSRLSKSGLAATQASSLGNAAAKPSAPPSCKACSVTSPGSTLRIVTFRRRNAGTDLRVVFHAEAPLTSPAVLSSALFTFLNPSSTSSRLHHPHTTELHPSHHCDNSHSLATDRGFAANLPVCNSHNHGLVTVRVGANLTQH